MMKKFITLFLIGILMMAAFVPPSAAGNWMNPTKPTVDNWHELALNVTSAMKMISSNRTQIMDAELANTTMIISAATSNISLSQTQMLSAELANTTMILTASSSNITAAKTEVLTAELANTTMVISAADTNLTAYKSEISQNGTAVLLDASGLDYTLTNAWANIILSQQALNFTLPSIGSYLVMADVHEYIGVGNIPARVFSEYALCDADGTTIVTNTERMGTTITQPSNVTEMTHHFSWIYTNSTDVTNVSVCAKVSTVSDVPWTVNSSATGRSVLNWLRLP